MHFDPVNQASVERVVGRAFDSREHAEFAILFAQLPGVDRERLFGPPEANPDRFQLALDGLAEIRSWCQSALGPQPSSTVLLDSTTIHQVDHLTGEFDSGTLFANQAWDLASVSEAAVLYDRIVVLENPHGTVSAFAAGANRLLGEEVFVPLIPSGPAVLFFLSRLHSQAEDFLGQVGRAQPPTFDALNREYCQTWARFLALSPDEVRIDADRFGSNSPIDFPSQMAHSYRLAEDENTCAPWIPSAPASKRRSWNSVIAEATFREELSNALAYALRVPYIANAFRAPIRFSRMTRSARLEGSFAVSRLMRRQLHEARRTAGLVQAHSALPALLTGVLNIMGNRADFWPSLAVLRREARGYRTKRSSLTRAVQAEDFREIKKLKAAVLDEEQRSHRWIPAAASAGVAGGVTVLHAAYPALATAPLLIQAAAACAAPAVGFFAARWLKSIYRAAFEPQYRVLASVGDAARTLGDSIERLEELWAARVPAGAYGRDQLGVLAEWSVLC
jgi:hypothetical protein